MTSALLNFDRPRVGLDDLDHYSQWLVDDYGAHLISLWPCDERPGATDFREVISGHDSSISGTYTLGQTPHVWDADGAAAGDGSTAVSNPPDTNDFRFGSSQDFSVSIWLDKLTVDSAQGWFLGFYNGGSGKGWVLLHADNGMSLTLRWLIDDGSNRDEIRGTSLPADQPVHIVAVCDRSSDEIRYYVDGSRQNTQSGLTAGNISPDAGPSRRLIQSSQTPYEGSHAAVFSTALTDADVTRIYQRGVI